MKVYTKTGDNGTTSLYSGERVAKDCLQVEAYGSVDEINSALGMARAYSSKQSVRETIYEVQKNLVLVMAELATNENKKTLITTVHVTDMEQMIDNFAKQLPPLTGFIIPGDSIGSAALDKARTITRRAERQTLRCYRELEAQKPGEFNTTLLVYLNRLSDLCFMLSRLEVQK